VGVAGLGVPWGRCRLCPGLLLLLLLLQSLRLGSVVLGEAQLPFLQEEAPLCSSPQQQLLLVVLLLVVMPVHTAHLTHQLCVHSRPALQQQCCFCCQHHQGQ
jgi:hypothetical protein